MIEPAPKKNIAFYWFRWHFFEIPKKIIKIFWNFLVFNFHYFSITLLLKTLFSHWKKYRDFYPKGLDIKKYSYIFISNTISRLIGAIVRTTVIALGLVLEVLIFITAFIVLFSWIFLPLIIIFLFVSGIQFLI